MSAHSNLILSSKLSRKLLFWAFFNVDKEFLHETQILSQGIDIIQGVKESLCLGPELMWTVFVKF